MSKLPVFGATAWLTACLFPAPVTAQSRQDTDPLDRDIVAVGAGLAVVPDYEGSNHYRPVVAPAALGSVKGHSFVVAGNQASLNLLRDRPGPVWQVQVGPFAQINFNRSVIGAIHDPRVLALGALGLAVQMGGDVGVQKTGVVTSSSIKSGPPRGCCTARPCGSVVRLRWGWVCAPRRTKAPDRMVWGFCEEWLRGQDLNL